MNYDAGTQPGRGENSSGPGIQHELLLIFPYDHEDVINPATHLGDIYRKKQNTKRVVIATVNCLLPLPHFSCKVYSC